MIKQLSIFVENKAGRLAEITAELAKAGVDIRALSVADTTNFGILRLIVDKPDEAERILREAGLTVSLTGVIAVGIPDQPGGFAAAMPGARRCLDRHRIHVRFYFPGRGTRLRHPAGGRQCRRCSGSREKRHPVVGRRQGIFHVTLQTPAALETTGETGAVCAGLPCSFLSRPASPQKGVEDERLMMFRQNSGAAASCTLSLVWMVTRLRFSGKKTRPVFPLSHSGLRRIGHKSVFL